MKRTHPAFWGAGWAGLFVGAVLALVGLSARSEFANLYGGYGLLLMAAALYLVAGLGLREALARRSSDEPVSRPSRMQSATVGPRNS